MPRGDYFPNTWPVVGDQAMFDELSDEFDRAGTWNEEVSLHAGERLVAMRAANPELAAAHDAAAAERAAASRQDPTDHLGHLAAAM